MRRHPAAAFLACIIPLAGLGAEPSSASASETRAEFGTVVQGAPVEHAFVLRNDGSEPLRIASVQLTPPLQLGKMPAVIPAGTETTLKLTLDTTRVKGDYEGKLQVTLDGASSAPRTYALAGKVVPALEILPQPAFFLSTPKGTEKSASLEIVNRAPDPLTLTFDPVQARQYRANLETIEAGRRYRLTATIPASAPAGKTSERLTLASSNTDNPAVHVGMNVVVRERVYNFPDTVDFGTLKLREFAQGNNAVNSQTLMVYQTGGHDFSVTARSDVAGVELAVEPSPKGDRVQVTASLSKSRAKPGLISGAIHLHTNDPAFPDLEVPVTGEVTAD
jgi:hypothetical protein